ncbi:MAG TPA: endonuclease III [Candidatus Aenigmarchaeota archaeon]|nr:endonuclease III [Candidatus Aenigmarchaeota archaeon]
MSALDILKELLNYYGGGSLWKEVKEVFESEGVPWREKDFSSPFQNLVAVILSQNTSDRNSTRAYIGLLKKFGKITPETLRKAREEEIREAIKPGGLYNLKAKRLKELAEVFDKINIEKLRQMGREEARKELMKIKGIGQKSADVFLNYVLGKPSFPIDTNIKRVIKRLGWVKEGANYEEMRRVLENKIPKKYWRRAHELLIRLGRDLCRPRNPKCGECPIREFCEFGKRYKRD